MRSGYLDERGEPAPKAWGRRSPKTHAAAKGEHP